MDERVPDREDTDFHILLTNDDGVESPGLVALAERLGTLGSVTVVAPCGEQSGSSMAVALRDQLTLRPVGDGWCVNTTPAGAGMLALSSLVPAGGFDLVVSGINRGANVGTASHMSGTVGAAMMGALFDVPAIAVSSGAPSQDFSYAADFTVAFIRQMRRHPVHPGLVYSINLPQASEDATAGVRIAPMGGMHLHIEYEEIASDGPDRLFRPRISLETQYPTGSDTEGLFQNMITITPLRFDWTDRTAIAELRGWGLSPRVR